MELFNTDAYYYIALIIALGYAFHPWLAGIPMCLFNRNLSGWNKLAWCLIIIIGGLLGFLLYLVLNKKTARQPGIEN